LGAAPYGVRTEIGSRVEPQTRRVGADRGIGVQTGGGDGEGGQRLDIQTAQVRQEEVKGTRRLAVPYAAVIYGAHGETWVYTNPESLAFVRAPITVDTIDGDTAYLLVGPPIGTAVVTVGGAELYGTETGVSK
jgi:hypothetical protein